MANYTATARSNYFRVKDIDAFRKLCDSLNCEVITRGTGGEQLVALLGPNDDCGMWPSQIIDDDTDESRDFDLVDELTLHIADGWVCILMEAGSEKHRYVTGRAVAFNNAGVVKTIDIGDIMDLAKELGPNITAAES